MIDIPGIYVGRFKDDPNQSPMLMQTNDTPTYTDDNWANVESTGTIWRYSSKVGEWVDTGLEEILVEEVSGTKEIVAEGTVLWKLQGLKVCGKSTQQTTTGAQLFDMKTALSDTWIIQNSGETETAKGYWTSDYTPVREGSYYLSYKGSSRTALYDAEKTFVRYLLFSGAGSFNINNGEAYIRFSGSPDYPPETIMFNAGSTALPWEPYTGGKPSPSPDYPQEIVTAGSDGSIDITVSDGADQSQQLSIQTPNGLPGIPSEQEYANYQDSSGSWRRCNIIDLNSGVIKKCVLKTVLTGEESYYRFADMPNTFFVDALGFPNAVPQGSRNRAVCSHFPFETFGYAYNTFFIQGVMNYTRIVFTVEYDNVGDLKQFITQQYQNETPVTIISPLGVPIETPLSAEELAAYAALMSYDGSTVISTDEDVSGISAKVVTDVISKNAWFDPYAELALYYKALAGFESLDNLPMPHSRESSLVRKLLDSSYELGFGVNENSSRNERYLWDLINGTSVMLTNVPKSDTEKFLHVMIGGTVEEYPVVDTELDYWMDKCVHYMNSNGNIGG